MPRLLDHVSFPKILIVLSVTFVVALGACGLTGAFGNNNAGTFIFIELGVMALSAVGLTLTAIVWIVVAATGNRGAGEPGTAKLFNDSDDGMPKP